MHVPVFLKMFKKQHPQCLMIPIKDLATELIQVTLNRISSIQICQVIYQKESFLGFYEDKKKLVNSKIACNCPCCLPREGRGLGYKSMEDLNRALVSKLSWNMAADSWSVNYH